MKRINLWALALACATILLSNPTQAQPLQITNLTPGFVSQSYSLGAPFVGVIAPLATNPDLIYLSAGSFGNQSILRLDSTNGTTTTVANGFGNLGGMVSLPNDDLVLTENSSSDTIILCRDLNNDDDFLDANEVVEIIDPILDNGDFSGAQIALAPAGNASAIPAGALVVQTADGGTAAELLVVENPLTAPAFRPVGQAYYSGFAFNGGVAFDNAGNLIMGSSSFPDGQIFALVNTNGNQQIEAGESNVIVAPAQLNGISDLAIAEDERIYTTENSGIIRRFIPPANLLTGQATGFIFAETNGLYLSTLRFNDRALEFEPGAGENGATLWIGGFTNFFGGALNLIAIRPVGPTAVSDWNLFE